MYKVHIDKAGEKNSRFWHFFRPGIEMEKVTLQFQTPQDLSNFRKAACEIKEINIRELIMVCECSSIEIARAMNYYGAMVIEEHESRKL